MPHPRQASFHPEALGANKTGDPRAGVANVVDLAVGDDALHTPRRGRRRGTRLS
jgi:hypothetical protein